MASKPTTTPTARPSVTPATSAAATATATLRRVHNCPTCGWPLSRERHGWISAPLERDALDRYSEALRPCPTCTPLVRARRAQAAISGDELWRPPAYTDHWTWQTLWQCPDIDRTAATYARVLVTGWLAGDPATAGAKSLLYLHGRFGRGKTGMAVSAIRDALADGRTAAFISVAALMNAIKDTYGDRSNTRARKLLDVAERVDLLVLDDLGVEAPTRWTLEQLYLLLEARRGRVDRLTIITCNLSVRDLGKVWTDAAQDRQDQLHQIAVGRIIERLSEFCLAVEVKGARQRPTLP